MILSWIINYFPSLFFLVLLLSVGQAYGADLSLAKKVFAPSDGGRYTRMANNFFIIYDAAHSMNVPYKDTNLPRMEAENQIIRRSNATLPDLGWQAAVYPPGPEPPTPPP